jgi:predicted nucleic acid-binding protein
MTGAPLILDADGLDALTEQPPPDRLRALLAEAWNRQSDVLVPALVCAECSRGARRTRAIEASLARHRDTRAARPAVRVVPTDFDLARRVGSVLNGAGAGTRDIVDAHSVAVASMHGRAVIATSDPDDILRLASAMPVVRIVTRSAR